MKKIRPRTIRSISKFRQSIAPSGYDAPYISVQGPRKRMSIGSDTAYQKFAGGYSPGLQLEAKESINEQINGIIRKHASSHVNKYLRSDDGKALRQEVKQLIRMKLGKKNL